MGRLNITAKIWLSIAVFVLGFVFSTILGQWQGLSTERTMRVTSDALFPAAQKSQDAEAGFARVVKGFSDAVLVQDASGLEKANEEGRQVVQSLNAVAAISALPEERTAAVKKLASSVDQLVSDARQTYGAMLTNPAAMSSDIQDKMRDLATRTDTIKAGLKSQKEQFSRDLRESLETVGTKSARQRWLALIVFLLTLAVAGVIVNLTIRRSIVGPVSEVISGVQEAAAQATEASERMAKSGQLVARDAQDQAACIEETSASLEEISATTRQNSTRAQKADELMRETKATVGKAAEAMNDLTTSMDVISKSSHQVADVLKSIDEIAFHTNILALNAAVEAARAGEAGAGFSVVADEVRSLAHRAADAARRSADIIERTITDVKKGVELVSVAHGAFQEVSTTITSGSQVVAEIAASSEEQSRGVAHIGEAVTRMEKVTQNNAANAQETAETASAMREQMQTTRKHLKQLVSVVGL